MAEAVDNFGDDEDFSRGDAFEKRSGIIESPSSLPIWRSCRHPDDETTETQRFADIVHALFVPPMTVTALVYLPYRDVR